LSLVELCRLTDNDAELLKGRLEMAGIEAFCFGEDDPIRVDVIGVRVMVNDDDLEAARNVYRQDPEVANEERAFEETMRTGHPGLTLALYVLIFLGGTLGVRLLWPLIRSAIGLN